MKPTQNNRNGGNDQPKLHRMPRRFAPDIDKIGKKISTENSQNKTAASSEQRTPPKRKTPPQKTVQNKKRRKRTTLAGAILAEIEDRLDGLSLNIPFTAEQFLRAAICGVLIILFAMLETTVFSRFKPFGAIPDLMFALTVAIAFSEGEKWGGVCGIISAVIIDALTGVFFSLLPILYMMAGVLCGYLVRDFFSNTALPRVAVITLFTVGRSVVTLISAVTVTDAPISEIMLDMVIPEYFSTVLMSAPVYLTVWLCYFKFHKTRAERTAG